MKNIAIYGIVGLVVLSIMSWLLLTFNLARGLTEGSHIYFAVHKCSQKFDSDVIIIGDSVGGQMYHTYNYSGRINSMCTAMPVTMAGQYLLLANYAKHNNIQGKRVILLYSPIAFESEFSSESSFHYFLKPFYNQSFFQYYDDYLESRFDKNLSWVAGLPVIKLTNWQPPEFINYVNLPESVGGEISNTSVHYLLKMVDLSNTYKFDFEVKCTLQARSKTQVEYKELTRCIEKYSLHHFFRGYFDDVIYIDDEEFQDGVHVKNPAKLPVNILGL